MVTWQHHRAHRLQVIADRGQWIGLFDENGVPVMDMPSVVEASARRARGTVTEEVELTFGVASPSGRVHRAVAELIADELGQVDAEGQLVPANVPTRLLVIERPGVRAAYKVTHCTAIGGADGPSTLRVHGVEIAAMLAAIPAWSYPLSVTGQWHRLDRDYAAPWSREMDLQNLEMGVQADGFTVSGPALSTIHRVVTESLDATWRAVGISDDPPIQVAAIDTGVASPTVMIRPQDDSLWDTVAEMAMRAGVELDVSLWLPGDDQPAGLDLSAPTVVVAMRQGGVG